MIRKNQVKDLISLDYIVDFPINLGDRLKGLSMELIELLVSFVASDLTVVKIVLLSIAVHYDFRFLNI